MIKRTLLLAVVCGFCFNAVAAPTAEERFRDGMAQIDAKCRKRKIGPYLDPSDPQYQEKRRETGCQILTLPTWKRFVEVEGQPEPVPEQWVATPEGKFAHSIKIPNPVPKDSGYKRGMSGEEYFKHLCQSEAGEFVFKKIEKVDGIFQMRTMDRVWDDKLKHLYELEYPSMGSAFYAGPPETMFVRSTRYKYFESARSTWHEKYNVKGSLLRFSGYNEFTDKGMIVSTVESPASRYGFTWRGLRRPHDRENGIAGGEVIVVDLKTNEVLGVRRTYLRSGDARKVEGGIWWLGAHACPAFTRKPYQDPSQQLSNFIESVIKPVNQ